MIEELDKYARGMGANAEVLGWLWTTGKKALLSRNGAYPALAIEHILDFLVSPAAPARLQKMSIADAQRKASEWSKANQKKGRNLVDDAADLETIHDFGDGSKIVQLKTKKALQREGFLMSHCVGGYSPTATIYSYRDADNMPHATFEVQTNDKEIVQIKGKGNGAIHPKYIHPILAFLKAIGLDIRPADMVNLGYHHLPKEHLEFLKNFKGIEKQMTMIHGEAYAF